MILAIETSCDDTCAAVLGWDGVVGANVISSQLIHERYGGVVPEIASRRHLELIDGVLDEALARAGVTLDDVDLVAATRGPGLVAALLVGFSAAKALAAARELPFAAVDHLRGHVAASFLEPNPFEPPFLSLIASGGHTLLQEVRDPSSTPRLLGQTLDDAAGEAFDKGARMLGLGYPGGAALERLAREGDPGAFEFPTGVRSPGLDFSFAGRRPRCSTRSVISASPRPSAAERIWRPPISARSSRRSRSGSGARSSRQVCGGWRSAAASRPTARCASG